MLKNIQIDVKAVTDEDILEVVKGTIPFETIVRICTMFGLLAFIPAYMYMAWAQHHPVAILVFNITMTCAFFSVLIGFRTMKDPIIMHWYAVMAKTIPTYFMEILCLLYLGYIVMAIPMGTYATIISTAVCTIALYQMNIIINTNADEEEN